MIEYILDEKYEKLNKSPKFKQIKYIIKDKCWICTSHAKMTSGYPRINRNGKGYGLHRYVYELFKGNIPKNYVIMHECDNKLCINPDHLKIGTQQDNMNDMKNKGKSPKSSKGNMYKRINKETFNKVLELLQESRQETIKDKFNRISKLTGISTITIGRIRSGQHKWCNEK